MDVEQYFNEAFSRHTDVIATTWETVRKPFICLVAQCVKSVQSGGKIVFLGNGGSAADCQHLAAELTIRYISDRPPIPAIALTTDTSALTAAGNDLGFDKLFSRQVEALCQPEDIVIGLSTSGNSANVFNALRAAREIGCTIAAFSGRGGGKMKNLANPLLMVPSSETARIQEMHILIGHALCEALEKELGLI